MNTLGLTRALWLLVVLALAGCVDGDPPGEEPEGPAPLPPPPDLDGAAFHYTVQGLEGSGGVLRVAVQGDDCTNPLCTGGADIPLTEDGTFTADLSLPQGQQYSASISPAPANPVQRCHVENGFGTIGSEDVSVVVTCSDGHLIHYTVEGLEGSGGELVMILTHSEQGVEEHSYPLTEDGTFTADDTRVLMGWQYRFLISRAPSDPEQQCRVENGLGQVTTGDVTDVRIVCDSGHLFHYTVEGLEGQGGELKLGINSTDPDCLGPECIDDHPLPLTTNGTFTADGVRLHTGRSYSVIVSQAPTDPVQRCELDHLGGTVGSEDVSVVVTCHRGHLIHYTVKGLEGSGGELGLVLSHSEQGVEEHRYPLTDNGTFTADDTRVVAGWHYHFLIHQSPTDPHQQCDVENDRGEVTTEDVTDVTITCSSGYEFHYTVEGLQGSGGELLLTLSHTQLGVEQFSYPLTADGAFRAEGARRPAGWLYSFRVVIPPNEPAQVCNVENGFGEVTTHDVTDALVTCETPPLLRRYRFDDTSTFEGSSPLSFGEQRELMGLDADYFYGTGPAVPLGTVSGLDDNELFRLQLDGPGASGLVHSNDTGFTYWLAAESPPGSLTNPIRSHYASLNTVWRLRKEDEDATFQLVVSQVRALGYVDSPFSTPERSLRAGGEIAVHAHVFEDGAPNPAPFFSTHGGVYLVGEPDPNDIPGDRAETLWQVETHTNADVADELWAADDFDLNSAQGVPALVQPEQVAYLSLRRSLPIDVDLSSVPVGAEIVVVSSAFVRAHNNYSPEGASAVFLRDPGEADAGSPEGGVEVTRVTGLRPLPPLETYPEDLPSGGGAAPQACDPGTTEVATLAFETSEYRLRESDEAPARVPLRVTRTDSITGLVTAQVSLTAGDAVAGEDFVDAPLTVRFGEQSSAPRSLRLPIVDDRVEEAEETFTLTLHSPEGCAVVGLPDTVVVTIVDDDSEQRGSIAFVTDTLLVDESAGTALLQLERVGGSFGSVGVTIDMLGVTAEEGTDFLASPASFVFADGESGPASIAVPITDDAFTEDDETFTVSLGGDDAGPVSLATVTIRDDDQDQPNTLQFGSVPASADEAAGAVSVEVTRWGRSDGAVSVRLTTEDGSATAADGDYAPLDTVITFADGETTPQFAELAILDDTLTEGPETLTLRLADASGDVSIGDPAMAQIEIVDDDTGGWSMPELVEESAAGAQTRPEIAIGANGEAMVVWENSSSTIRARRYHPTSGWESPLDASLQRGDAPRVSVDAGGNAVAAWGQSPVPHAAQYLAGSGWQSPEPISPLAAQDVRLAGNQAGEAAAAWIEPRNVAAGNPVPDVWLNRFDGSRWLSAQEIDPTDTIASGADVAIDGDGNVIVVWAQTTNDGTTSSLDIYYASYQSATDTLSVDVLKTAQSGRAPFVVMNERGDAIVTWGERLRFTAGQDHDVLTTYFDATAGIWRGVFQVDQVEGVPDTEVGDAVTARPTLDPSGNAHVFWLQENVSSSRWAVWARRYDRAADSWTAPMMLSQPGARVSLNFMSAASDSTGHVVAIWQEVNADGTGYLVYANTFDAATESWTSPVQLGGLSSAPPNPEVAIDDNGRATAVWQESADGTTRIWLARFGASSP
jgi:hypothetical protein